MRRYLLVLAHLSADLGIDHRFGDGPERERSAEEKCQCGSSLVLCFCFVSVCVVARVCLHGLSGEVLAEVPHDVEGVDGGGGEDASGRLVAQICRWVGGHRDEEEEDEEARGDGDWIGTFVSKLKVRECHSFLFC